MDLARAIRIVKRQAGFRQQGDDTIIELLQDAQEQLETSWPTELVMPWFLVSERSITTSVENEERVLVPADFICELEEDALWLQLPEGGEKLLNKYDADDLRNVVSQYTDAQDVYTQNSYRFSYALTGQYFRIFPTPSVAYSYKLMYYKKDTVLDEADTSVTNLWLTHAPWVLVGSAGEMYGHALRDSTMMGFFQQKKAAALQALSNFTTTRQLANRRMAMGETL